MGVVWDHSHYVVKVQKKTHGQIGEILDNHFRDLKTANSEQLMWGQS